ncbi:hypothetical protein J7M28_11255 [bacterium]|nr:hypothetical protein [bacterium]
MPRVLIITTELLPTLPCLTVGGSQRTHALGESLKLKGHEVIYSLPLEHLRGIKPLPERLLETAHSLLDIDEIIERVSPDVVLFAAPYLARFMQEQRVPVVMDMAANVELETAFAPGENFIDVMSGRLDQYRKGDFFILGSPRQLYWYSAFLLLSGIPVNDDYFSVVPISCSPEQPDIPERNELRFLCAGMFYPWQDPFEALKDVLSTLEEHSRGELHIFAGREHPAWKSISSSLFDPEAVLGESDRLFIKGILPFDEAMDTWKHYSCAIDVMKPNIERMLANPMRTTTYLWLGIPVIVSDFYWVSELVREYDAGWVVSPNDTGAVREIVKMILGRPEILEERARNAQKLVADRLTWDKSIDGLDAFCKSPKKLQKRPSILSTLTGELNRLYSENIALGRNVGHVEGKLQFSREEIERRIQELVEQKADNADIRNRIDAILNSRTWRLVQFIKHKLLRMRRTPSES